MTTISSRKFYRAVYQVEVLSEEPFDATVPDLDNLNEAITTGGDSGQVSVVKIETVDGAAMANLLQAQGSEPGFFRLTDSGEDAEGEDYV